MATTSSGRSGTRLPWGLYICETCGEARGRTPEHLARLRQSIVKARAARTRKSVERQAQKILKHGLFARHLRGPEGRPVPIIATAAPGSSASGIRCSRWASATVEIRAS